MEISDQNLILRHVFPEGGDNDRQDIIQPGDSTLGNIDTKHNANSDWNTSAAGIRIHQLHNWTFVQPGNFGCTASLKRCSLGSVDTHLGMLGWNYARWHRVFG
jgi:hypothetical protein